ncbi:SURF6-domain-containing protein [Aspergillus heteromorphus CBS 117.55]|uniref:SURF6-domain-containing protein n=1 Tax=Aspergillus heteromorphus CBS 117.55 TaxID=1448321 RepID=A0A317VPF3_9EURO|nr:SURF6-domain-containing protein [Aspergillus heteromorphus CBS 117.55]PWY76264.1 SURF6-domain-containing protein [Aspergillus heteromorphus CBS 117.55]
MPSLLFFLCLLFFSLPQAFAAAIPGRPTVYLIRHGEKPPDPEDSGLNADGFKRAECLREVFGATSPYDIAHVMAPKINSLGQHRRPYETVLPVATDLNLPVDTSCKRNRAECVAKRIREFKGPGNILISWRHGKMREIAQALGYEDPPAYPDERFDLVWTIPFPYDNITSIRSERCPGLDVPHAMKPSGERERQDFKSPTQFFRGIAAFATLPERCPQISFNLQERLRSHAQAFDGLLSLIPAKHYYGEDGSEQWKRKKQTKEQAREAKRAKLDPESAKSAKDVMDENARKRKRDEERKEGDDSSDGDLGSEMPKEGLKRGDAKAKKQKQGENSANADGTPAKLNEEAEARKKLKEDKKAQKKAAQKERKKAKDAAKKAQVVELPATETETKTPAAEAVQKSESAPAGGKSKKQEEEEEADSDNESAEGVPAEELSLEFNAEQDEQPSASSSNSPASNPQSGSSSISSIVPPTDASKTSTSEPKPLKPTPDQLKERLQKRLDELRAARQADGLNGRPARNRQELIEARRQKAEQRKAHKKLLRQKAKEEEEQREDEAMARRFSPGGSGSLLASPRSPAESVSSNNNYAFGRVVFGDGQQADPTLSSTREQPKHRQGTHDPAAALKAVEAKKAKLAAMDEEKRADIEEKDMWLNAKKRAHGERIRDDTSLLKKALKRKETAKKKSEREWKERLEAVKKGQHMKQQRREDNLRKRRDEKGGNKGNKKKPAGGAKKKSRPGFEGSFKSKSGGGKK